MHTVLKAFPVWEITLLKEKVVFFNCKDNIELKSHIYMYSVHFPSMFKLGSECVCVAKCITPLAVLCE